MTICRYHEAKVYVCEAEATHRLGFDTMTGQCLGSFLGAPQPLGSGRLPEEVFCLRHAGDVSQALQRRWQAAKAQQQAKGVALVGKRTAA